MSHLAGWRQALSEFAKINGKYTVPKRGTENHKKITEIYKGIIGGKGIVSTTEMPKPEPIKKGRKKKVEQVMNEVVGNGSKLVGEGSKLAGSGVLLPGETKSKKPRKPRAKKAPVSTECKPCN